MCSAPEACRCRISACVRPAPRSPRRVTTPWAVRASAASSASGCAISASRCRPSVFRPLTDAATAAIRRSRRSSTTARRGRAASRRRPPSRGCGAVAWVRLPVSIRSTSASSASASIPRISARTSSALPAASPAAVASRTTAARPFQTIERSSLRSAAAPGASPTISTGMPSGPQQLGEARRPVAGDQRGRADALPGHRRHERDVGEPGARRRDEPRELGLELRRAGVEVGERLPGPAGRRARSARRSAASAAEFALSTMSAPSAAAEALAASGLVSGSGSHPRTPTPASRRSRANRPPASPSPRSAIVGGPSATLRDPDVVPRRVAQRAVDPVRALGGLLGELDALRDQAS